MDDEDPGMSTAFVFPGCFFTWSKDYENKSLALGERLCDQSDASRSFHIKTQSRNSNIIISGALFTWCFLTSLLCCISIKLES